MGGHFHEFFVFAGCLVRYARYVRGILAGLLVITVLGGVAIAVAEGLPVSSGVYFAFVTGLTIGYGDIAPVTPVGRVLSLAIGMVGVVYTGLFVAIATRALADTHQELRRH